jgi:hypothetical protein
VAKISAKTTVHAEVLARGGDLSEEPQLLDWVAWAVEALMHDGSTHCVILDGEG